MPASSSTGCRSAPAGTRCGSNGRVYERVVAWLERREALALYHAALRVKLPEGSYVIEQAPVRDGGGAERGVVAEGAVGSRRAARFRIFRYELRCWRGGVIPDADEAVDSPRRLTSDPDVARRLLELVHDVPTATWGRDELGAGEMWNSNSLIAWLLRVRRDRDRDDPSAERRACSWLERRACRRCPFGAG